MNVCNECGTNLEDPRFQRDGSCLSCSLLKTMGEIKAELGESKSKYRKYIYWLLGVDILVGILISGLILYHFI